MTVSMGHQLIDQLQFQWQESIQPLVLVINHDLQLIEMSGNQYFYGFDDLSLAQNLPESLIFLNGVLSKDLAEIIELPLMTLSNQKVVHIHIHPHKNTWHVLFLSAADEHDRRQKDQQTSYDLRLLQRKLKHANAQLEEKNRQLSEANLAKGRFIANMSHEFRTPLTSVLGYSELIKEIPQLEPLASDYLSQIDRAANHLLVMIDNLLDQARIDAGQLDILTTAISLNELVEDITAIITPLAEHKNLSFKCHFSSKLPISIDIDGLRLRQILINVLGNAVKYTQSGQVDFHLDYEKGNIIVSVIDTGVGIAKADQVQVFNAFEQNGAIEKGAGLGLAITQQLCDMMGGSIRVESTLGEGTKFIMVLPAPLSEIKPLPEVNKSTASPVIDFINKRIMVVEDDEDIQMLLDIHLSRLGCQFKMCENGKEAIEQYEDYSPDLILMDMNMPVMDGLSATKFLRHQDYSKPIIALTASISASSKTRVLAAGCTDFLQKPVNREKMLSTLSQYLQNV